MHHIKIQGVIDSQDWGYGDIKVYTADKIESDLSKAKGGDLLIDIDSVGGCVHTGINIYSKIKRYAKKHNANVTTRTDGFVASIATIIFLAGDKRIVNEFMQPFVHEPAMWPMSENVDEIRKEADDLDTVRKMLADFYSKHTSLSYFEALDMMKSDTWLTADKSLEIGFATEIEELSNENYKVVASLKNEYKSKINNMSKKEGMLTRMGRFFNAIPAVKAELELADKAGNPVVFPELEAGDEPSEGDKVTVDGDANFTGQVETEKYIIAVKDGVVTEVMVIDEIDRDEMIDALLDKVEELKAQMSLKDKEVERL